jgi:hypothetical protein
MLSQQSLSSDSRQDLQTSQEKKLVPIDLLKDKIPAESLQPCFESAHHLATHLATNQVDKFAASD